MPLGVAPDGLNINLNCGATAPAAMKKAVAESAALGICLDGDADRLILADEQGQIVTAIRFGGSGTDAAEQGTLQAIVGTAMSTSLRRCWLSKISALNVGCGYFLSMNVWSKQGVRWGVSRPAIFYPSWPAPVMG